MAKDKITIGNPILVNGQHHVDYLYGPYQSIEAALAFIPTSLRYVGMTVGIKVDTNVVKEYWFNGGIANANFTQKQPDNDGQDIQSLRDKVQFIESIIPSTVSENNMLVDREYVGKALSTDSAHYISDNGKPFSSYEDLLRYSGDLVSNDYAFVVNIADSGEVSYTRYKYNAPDRTWSIEYVLQSNSFGSEIWQHIVDAIDNLDDRLTNLDSRVQALEEQGASGGDADSVNGYKIQVLFPQEFNIETARPDTIYLLLQTSQDTVVNIPSNITINYTEGMSYVPTKGTGWKFKGTPSPCTGVGTFLFAIEPEIGYIWNDGTKSGKVLQVTVLEAVVTSWKFGDGFPIIFSGEGITSNWKFGDSFPIIFQ